uniref:MCM N-terminal domain-containing protein n=1 Tax=Parascaris equorum TaxID=6256 RepID=A0A914RCL7_PAREQ
MKVASPLGLFYRSRSTASDDSRYYYHKIYRYKNEKEERRYKEAINELRNSERNTIRIDFAELFSYSSTLASAVELQFYRYRISYFICLKSAALDVCNDEAEKQRLLRKEIHVSFNNLGHKLRFVLLFHF